jgi:hypothetical protein
MRGNPQRYCVLKEGPQQFEISYVIGEVMGAGESYSTSVSGGEIRSSHVGGHFSVSGGGVSSTVTKHGQLFLRADNGDELDLKLTNCEVGFRPGHRMTLLIGTASNRWNYIGLINHNTAASDLWGAKIQALLPATGTGLFGLLLTLTGVFTAYSGVVAGGVALAVLGLVVTWFTMATAGQNSRLRAHVNGAFNEMQLRLRAHAAAQRAPRPLSAQRA